SARNSGIVSGTVYGVSTAGSIVGTLGTTFFLIPLIGTRAITMSLGAAGAVCGLALMGGDWIRPPQKAAKVAAGLVALVRVALAGHGAWSADLFDARVRAQMLKHADGRVAEMETEYNNLYIAKHGELLALSTRFRGDAAIDSMINLKDPDAMPVPYTQI